MRRADHLFQIIHALRGRRTVYRGVADLQRSGVPIEGEAGVGYMLRKE